MVFTIYGHGGHLGHVTWTIYTNFCSPIPMSLHMKFGFHWPSVFVGKMLKLLTTITNTITTDAGAWVYYKLAYEPLAQVS